MRQKQELRKQYEGQHDHQHNTSTIRSRSSTRPRTPLAPPHHRTFVVLAMVRVIGARAGACAIVGAAAGSAVDGVIVLIVHDLVEY